jgi:L-rhamnose mutarotase
VKDYWELVQRQVEKTAAMLQEGRANYSIIVLKEEKMFSCWCRTDDDAMALLMAAILLRTGRQDVHQLLDAIGHIDINQIDEIVEENLDEEEDEEGGWQ